MRPLLSRQLGNRRSSRASIDWHTEEQLAKRLEASASSSNQSGTDSRITRSSRRPSFSCHGLSNCHNESLTDSGVRIGPCPSDPETAGIAAQSIVRPSSTLGPYRQRPFRKQHPRRFLESNSATRVNSLHSRTTSIVLALLTCPRSRRLTIGIPTVDPRLDRFHRLRPSSPSLAVRLPWSPQMLRSRLSRRTANDLLADGVFRERAVSQRRPRKRFVRCRAS